MTRAGASPDMVAFCLFREGVEQGVHTLTGAEKSGATCLATGCCLPFEVGRGDREYRDSAAESALLVSEGTEPKSSNPVRARGW